MPADEPRTILVVDDDDVFRSRLVRAFLDRGFDARGAASGAEVAALVSSDSPELAVLDLRLPDGSGLDVLRVIKEKDPTTSVVVLTGYGSIATALEAVRLGATHYLTKPADADEILRAFERGKSDGASPPEHAPSLARTEWEHIQRVLTDCGGNVSQAARILGVHRRSLQRKLSKRPVLR
ncbi:MAG TPA: response regulator [Polyangiaceae bacterium]|jgi:two-component system response regulator RegA|nr:response regulator [Polyangiaceae bacterium]